MIKIYGKANCSFCVASKQLLDAKELPYQYLQLGGDFTTEEVKAIAPSARSYPIIFADGKFIGGFNELRGWLTEERGMGGPEFLQD